MKTISLLSLLLISVSLHAMEETEDKISPEFNYFDTLQVQSDGQYDSMGGWTAQAVQARHLPTRRIYVALFEESLLGSSRKGYSYQESLGEKSPKTLLNYETTEKIHTLILQAHQAEPIKKKAALDALHQVVKQADSEAKAWAFVAGICN